VPTATDPGELLEARLEEDLLEELLLKEDLLEEELLETKLEEDLLKEELLETKLEEDLLKEELLETKLEEDRLKEELLETMLEEDLLKEELLKAMLEDDRLKELLLGAMTTLLTDEDLEDDAITTGILLWEDIAVLLENELIDLLEEKLLDDKLLLELLDPASGSSIMGPPPQPTKVRHRVKIATLLSNIVILLKTFRYLVNDCYSPENFSISGSNHQQALNSTIFRIIQVPKTK
jgi:hypothetical protein